jgi:hypothetical protein
MLFCIIQLVVLLLAGADVLVIILTLATMIYTITPIMRNLFSKKYEKLSLWIDMFAFLLIAGIANVYLSLYPGNLRQSLSLRSSYTLWFRLWIVISNTHIQDTNFKISNKRLG